MRPLLAIIVVFAILGGLQGYLSSRPTPKTWSEPEQQKARGKFEIKITLTFDAGPDPFSFDATEAPSLLAQFKGEPILKRTDEIASGTIVESEISSIVAGQNEFFISVSPKNSDTYAARAIRVQITRDSPLIAEKSIWSEPGGPVGGTVLIDVDPRKVDQSHEL